MHTSRNKIVFPAKAEIHPSAFRVVEEWVPAFAGKTAWVIGCLAGALLLAIPAVAAETPPSPSTIALLR